jgi:hypothetical protein
MSENNTTTTEKTRKTTEQKQAEKAAREAAQATRKAAREAALAARTAYASAEEAQAHKPDGEAFSKFVLCKVVSPEGQVCYLWDRDHVNALLNVVKKAGWTTSVNGRGATPEKVKNLLSQLSPEDRATLIAQFVPPTQPTAPTSEKAGRKSR